MQKVCVEIREGTTKQKEINIYEEDKNSLEVYISE